jgi:hypothetical protein
MSKQPTRGFITYDTYKFATVDPVIDEMRTALDDSGHKASWVCGVSRLSTTTASNWFRGKTRRPQNASISAFMGALGYRRKWIRDRDMQTFAEELAEKRAQEKARKRKSNGKSHA